ncbi:MAG: OsmC family protein [Bacteroidales bacterium]
MENMFTVYEGDLKTRIIHLLSGTEIMTDAPPDNQGKGEYFSPTDLVATALGSCMLTVMGILARNHGFDIDGTTAKIIKIMGSDPRRIAEIKIELTFPHDDYSGKVKHFLDQAAKLCPVANSLHPDLKQTVIFNFTPANKHI